MILTRVFAFAIAVLLGFSLNAQTIVSYEKPSEKEFKKAVNIVLNRTSCMPSDMDARHEAFAVIQREMNNFSSKQWKSYIASDSDAELDSLEKNGTLYFYAKAMSKVLKQVRHSKPKRGEVFLWNLYNMGYIVKTPSQTFAVDLVHKHIDQFAGLLDFVLITHKHTDHGSKREFDAFAAAGVDVYAGYMPESLPENIRWNFVEDGENFKVGKVSITGRRGDHFYKGEGFKMVTTFEIDCGDDASNTVIYHTGDCRNYEQLHTEKPVDFFIFHTAVGLKIQKAIDKIQPGYAVFSHAWEMGHSVEKWRWTIDDMSVRAAKITGFPAERILLPCWGDKITVRPDDLAELRRQYKR